MDPSAGSRLVFASEHGARPGKHSEEFPSNALASLQNNNTLSSACTIRGGASWTGELQGLGHSGTISRPMCECTLWLWGWGLERYVAQRKKENEKGCSCNPCSSALQKAFAFQSMNQQVPLKWCEEGDETTARDSM